MGRYDYLLNQPKTQPPSEKQQGSQSSQPRQQTSKHVPKQSTSQSTNKSTTQSTNRQTNQSLVNQLVKSTGKVVDRSKAFYITERLDKRLDEAVRYFQERHGIRKVDRSIIVNAMLDNDGQWSDDALDKLVSRVIKQLTSRLTG